MNIADLETKTREELLADARELGITGLSSLKKEEIVMRLLQANAEQQGYSFRGGILEIMNDGYGFLRQTSLRPESTDIYVSQSQIRRFSLRTGDVVTGQVRMPKDGEKYHSLLRVETVNNLDPESSKDRPLFDRQTPTFPKELLDLETKPNNYSTRLINLMAPIGRGQRGIIVSPPKAGKTFLLKHIANAITTKYDNVHLIICLIGERPEEVTDWKKTIQAEVVASTFDEPVEEHTRVAELALERAKRLVELGQDVVILLDSITRLTRAYNLEMPSSGRTLSGGVDPAALYSPKRFFGSARKLEEGGSLTVIATCLVDTGSRMDEVIYEEFKGTGNMEIHLDRRLAERRMFPAIDVQRSGTRHEELLLDETTLRQIWIVRRMIAMINSNSPNSTEASERILERLSKTSTNTEFLNTLTKEF